MHVTVAVANLIICEKNGPRVRRVHAMLVPVHDPHRAADHLRAQRELINEPRGRDDRIGIGKPSLNASQRAPAAIKRRAPLARAWPTLRTFTDSAVTGHAFTCSAVASVRASIADVRKRVPLPQGYRHGGMCPLLSRRETSSPRQCGGGGMVRLGTSPAPPAAA